MILRTFNQNWHPPPPIRIRTYGFQLKIGEWGFVLLCLLFDIWYTEYDEAADKACFSLPPTWRSKWTNWNVEMFKTFHDATCLLSINWVWQFTLHADGKEYTGINCKTTRPKQPIRTSAISLPDLDLPLVKRRQVVYTRLQMNSIINSYSISLGILLTRYMGRQAKMPHSSCYFLKFVFPPTM